MIRRWVSIIFLVLFLIIISREQAYCCMQKSFDKAKSSLKSGRHPKRGTAMKSANPQRTQNISQPARRVGWDGQNKGSESNHAKSKSKAANRTSSPGHNTLFSYSLNSIKNGGNWKNTRVIKSTQNGAFRSKKNWKRSSANNVRSIRNTRKAN